MEKGGRSGVKAVEAIPSITLRADDPLHMQMLMFAQQGLDANMGPGAPAAVELRRISRQFERYWERRGGFHVSCAMPSGRHFERP